MRLYNLHNSTKIKPLVRDSLFIKSNTLSIFHLFICVPIFELWGSVFLALKMIIKRAQLKPFDGLLEIAVYIDDPIILTYWRS